MFNLQLVLMIMKILLLLKSTPCLRSSALASKATGYPIAKVASKLAIGYSLDELDNPNNKINFSIIRANTRLRNCKNSKMEF